jgi:hypothetical protein
MIEQTDAVRRRAERDEALAEQAQSHGRPVALELIRLDGRDPVLAHELAHRRARSDARQ